MRLLTALLFLCLAAIPAWSWGPTGHHVVAMIAEERLSPEVQDRIRKLLGEFTMAQASTCPDVLRAAERHAPKPEEQYCLKIASVIPNTSPWHYIDIPVPTADKALKDYCPQDACVTAKIRDFRNTLKNSNDDAKRREALMYLIHFIGDIHQPLHCSERSCDQGGNLEHVNVFLKAGERPDERLHGAWDVDLVDRLMEEEKIADEEKFARSLARDIKPATAAKWQISSIDEVAWEGWKIAKEHVYRDVPFFNYCDPAVKASPTPASDLKSGYEKEGTKIIHEQLMKAGVRLAAMIESSLTR
jgi:hypothetical protein